jgi:hypothetical protein
LGITIFSNRNKKPEYGTMNMGDETPVEKAELKLGLSGA